MAFLGAGAFDPDDSSRAIDVEPNDLYTVFVKEAMADSWARSELLKRVSDVMLRADTIGKGL